MALSVKGGHVPVSHRLLQQPVGVTDCLGGAFAPCVTPMQSYGLCTALQDICRWYIYRWYIWCMITMRDHCTSSVIGNVMIRRPPFAFYAGTSRSLLPAILGAPSIICGNSRDCLVR